MEHLLQDPDEEEMTLGVATSWVSLRVFFSLKVLIAGIAFLVFFLFLALTKVPFGIIFFFF